VDHVDARDDAPHSAALSAAQIMVPGPVSRRSLLDTQRAVRDHLQHFFWFFGHPEVYVLMVPGFDSSPRSFGVLRKVIFGYATLVAATVSIGASRWHVAITCSRRMGGTLNRSRASTMPRRPTGVEDLQLLGTLYGGKLRFRTPLIFCCAFLFQFSAPG